MVAGSVLTLRSLVRKGFNFIGRKLGSNHNSLKIGSVIEAVLAGNLLAKQSSDGSVLRLLILGS